MKVFINPGHSKNGNPDPGCYYNSIKESDICYDLSEKVANLLKSKSIDAVVYQQSGSNLTSNAQLNKVPVVANQSNADIFVSIHMNGFSDESAKGVETLYMSTSENSKKLANSIQNQLILPFNSYRLYDRGAKADTRGLLVLRATSMPAILVEVGFISNKNEANFIKSNLDNIAERICRGICAYFNVKYEDKSKVKIRLEQDSDNLYNCYVDDVLKLKANRLQTCLNWIEENYA